MDTHVFRLFREKKRKSLNIKVFIHNFFVLFSIDPLSKGMKYYHKST